MSESARVAELREQIRQEGLEWEARMAQVDGPLPTSDELQAILLDVLAGRPGPPDEEPRLALQRTMMVEDVAEIAAAGGVVDIPAIIPDPTEPLF